MHFGRKTFIFQFGEHHEKKNRSKKKEEKNFQEYKKQIPVEVLKKIELGQNCKDNMEYEKAIKHFQKALNISPHCYQLYNKLASTYKYQGKRKLAIEMYEKALSYAPGDITAHCGRLLLLNYEGYTKEEIANEHKKWGKMYGVKKYLGRKKKKETFYWICF